MRDGKIDATIYRTRKERQAHDRKIKRRTYGTYLRQAGILGIATGLAINSLMLSHQMQGTEAMLTSQATTTLSFSAVDHFQGWYQGLVDQVSSDCREGNTILAAIQRHTVSDDDSSHLFLDEQQIQQLTLDAQHVYSKITKAAIEDENKAQISPVESLLRVEKWGQDAQEKALKYLKRLQNDLVTVKNIVKAQSTVVDDTQCVTNHFTVSNFDQLAGGDLNGSSHAAVTDTVYTVTYGTYMAQSEQGQTLLPNVLQVPNTPNTVTQATYQSSAQPQP